MLFTKYIPAAFVVSGLVSARPAPSISLEVTLHSDESYNMSPANKPTSLEVSHQLALIGQKASEVSRTSLSFQNDPLPFFPQAIKDDLAKLLKEIAAAIDITKNYTWQNYGYLWDTLDEFSSAVEVQAKIIRNIAPQLASAAVAGDIKLQLLEAKDSLQRLTDPLVSQMPKCPGGEHTRCKDQGLSNAGYMLQWLGFAADALNRNIRAEGAVEL